MKRKEKTKMSKKKIKYMKEGKKNATKMVEKKVEEEEEEEESSD